MTKAVALGVTMVIPSGKNELEGFSVLKKIELKGEVDEGREVIVRYETAALKWKGFESYLVMWTKIYQRI